MGSLPVRVQQVVGRWFSTARHFHSAYPDTVKAAQGRFEYLRDSLSWNTYEMTPGDNGRALRYLSRALSKEPTYVDLHAPWHVEQGKVDGSEEGVCPWVGCLLRDIESDIPGEADPTFSALQPFSHGRISQVARDDLFEHVAAVELHYFQMEESSRSSVDIPVYEWLRSVASYLLATMRPDFGTARTFTVSQAEADAANYQALVEEKERLLELLVIHLA